MILQALTDYYEALARRGEIAPEGWAFPKVSFALELAQDGRLLRVVPLASIPEGGKKPVPQTKLLPAAVKRTVGISANFLWDNSAYLLGIDGKGNPERAKECFAAAKALHLSLLGETDDAFARAICAFFARWDPDSAAQDPVLTDTREDLLQGGNLVFLFDGRFPDENPALCQAWQTHYDRGGEGETMRCLVTGQEVVPEAVHPSIKNVMGAQSSGAALVSFNGEAFCSYNRTQNLNAPVGKYAAFAYTTALNALLADREHVRRFGDTTVVFWAQDAEPAYQNLFDAFLDGDSENISNAELKGCMDDLANGRQTDWDAIPLHPENKFYILGLAPNAARLSVRFFLRDSFGAFAAHVQRHYRDIDIVTDNRSKWDTLPLWALLRETVNLNSKNKDPSPQMAGDTLRAILSGGRYPATLYQQTQLRIRAERDMTRGRAGIVKAYLTRLPNNDPYQEVLTVKLNEQTTYQPYVLGRLFSVLEGLQQSANPGINTTIKDKYFSSASATPQLVFPTLLNLAEKHLRKLDGGARVYWAKQVTDLTGRITDTYPAHYNLYDQGVFQLGYYHQTQKRYEKKEKAEPAIKTEEEAKHV
ncbi:MAG: type I-C CRISPR-associated protein Cas8c/Csd1 [Eubacteriales bacterium]|nr:type I-C CRISPR-associated protein Cas8c/Csd1 [Eubacteriales bacterium]